MRTEHKIVALTLAVALSACSKAPERSTGTAGDRQSASATTASKNLELAPTPYKRMRFVSDIEQSTGGVAMKPTKSAAHVAVARVTAPDPIARMASHQLSTVTTPEASAAQPSIVLASSPTAEPAHVMTASSEAVIDHAGESNGSGWLSGAHVVIRGGHVGDDKCDPRTDARNRGVLDGRPDSRMPLVPSVSAFGGGGFHR